MCGYIFIYTVVYTIGLNITGKAVGSTCLCNHYGPFLMYMYQDRFYLNIWKISGIKILSKVQTNTQQFGNTLHLRTTGIFLLSQIKKYL